MVALDRVIQKMSYRLSFKPNNSCSRKSINFNVTELESNNSSVWWQNLITDIDVSATLRPPCRCPSEGHYLLHLQLNKFVWNTFPDNARMNNLTDLNVGEVVYISIIFHVPASWLVDWMVTIYIFDGSLMAWHCKPARNQRKPKNSL